MKNTNYFFDSTKTFIFLILLITKLHAQETFIKYSAQSGCFSNARTLISMADSSYVLFSTYRVNSNPRFHLCKFNPSDSLLWSHDYDLGDNEASTMIKTSNGDFVMVGRAGSDMLVLRVDNNGNQIWARSMDNGNNEVADGVAELSNGDLLVSGHGIEAFLCRLNSAGTSIWMKKFHLEQNVTHCRVLKLDATSACLVGILENNMTYSTDVFLTKVDLAGNVIWHKVINAGGQEYVGDCIVDANGDIVATGRLYKQAYGRNYPTLFKMTSQRNLSFFYEYDDPLHTAKFNAVIAENADQLILAGEVSHSLPGLSNYQNPILARINVIGEKSWATQYILP